MPQPPFDPKSSWNRVRLAGCCALPVICLSAGCVAVHHLNPLQWRFFRGSLFNLVPRTWLGLEGSWNTSGAFHLEASRTLRLSAVLGSRSASPILESVPDGPSMAQVGKKQRLPGGKSLTCLCMSIMLTVLCVCCYWGKREKRDFGCRASPPTPFSVAPIDKPSPQGLCIMAHPEHVKWGCGAFPTEG